MSAAAARLSLRYETIRAAKNAACPAFNQNNSVNLDRLIPWLAAHPEIVDTFERMPNIAEEEARKTQVERRTKDALYHRTIGNLIPFDQAKRSVSAVAKIFCGKLYNLLDRLHLKFGIPKEELRVEIDAVARPLDPAEYERLLKEIGRNAK